MGKIRKEMLAPFPYFGGKSTVAHIVWSCLGDVGLYIEPFAGSIAVLLQRPHEITPSKVEIINDKDGYVTNVWRAIQKAPDEVAFYCDYPVNHIEYHARRNKLIDEKEYLVKKLVEDPEYYDAKLAGYWIYCMSTCVGGLDLRSKAKVDVEKGITSDRPDFSKGNGVHKFSIHKELIVDGSKVKSKGLYEWFQRLAYRLRFVKIFCGDWSRLFRGEWLESRYKSIGIFFDPPYSNVAGRDKNLYHTEDLTVAHKVREWCKEKGQNEKYRIVLAGYYEEHLELLDYGWRVIRWTANGGYGNTRKKSEYVNRFREALFISPHCLNDQLFPQEKEIFLQPVRYSKK